MFFCSEEYLLFFAAVFAAYWALPWARARVWLLLVASFYFYASWNRWLALVVAGSATLDYLLARALDGCGRPALRRALVAVSVVANLGLLCYFKYANFFLQSLEEAVRACGGQTHLPVLQVILPIGISFYTFEAINYTVDVYRRRIRAERNLAHFLLFITFFPHLVAGPIVRSRDFLPQIARRKRWDWARLNLGAQFFILGLFKKLAVADNMARFADPVFADPGQYGTAAVWTAVVAYALQIYCDFSGYTDMALGSAHMLGYKLAPNFNLPYLARNVSEFWRRWHISLSSWLRDYLFIPLGGSRGGPVRTAANLMITMTLGGLWHGASWTFVVWGVLHGLYLIAHRAFRAACGVGPGRWVGAVLDTVPGRAGCVALTFLTVSGTWVFFRAPDFGTATAVLGRLVPGHPGLPAPVGMSLFWVLVAVTVVCHGVGESDLWRRLAPRLQPAAVGLGYAAAVVATLVLTPDTTEKIFIYFQF